MEISTNPSSSSSSSSNIITRSDHYPTTFVQADSSSFKQVVQLLTGIPSDSPRPPPPPPPPSGKGNFVIPPIKTAPPKKQSSHKLYERRQSNLKNSLIIDTLLISGGVSAGSPRFSPRYQEILSPSCLEFPKLALNSPVTPLKNSNGEINGNGNGGDVFDKLSPLSEEERVISEKGFYLHKSPISTPRDSEPQLLPLFPLTSPKISPNKLT